MILEFGLLGAVEVRDRGALVDVGHVRQQSVLVALLVEEGRPVPVDRLLDRVWGERAPLRARETLYGYVSKLRKLLGLDIERSPAGYRLNVAAAQVDLLRFRALVRLGALDDALALWRGDAVEGLESPWFDALRESLHAERFAAELDRNDAALAQGRHAALLPVLRRMADERPHDERLAAQLMLALHLSGNDAEALRQYETVRRELADELGADPSKPLQDVHQRILAGDAGRAESLPLQLPAPQPWFTGREEELAALDPSGTVVITVIGGTGGIGKTALALHWAHRHADDFPDGQLYVNLRGFDPAAEPTPPETVLREFLEALGEEMIPEGLDARAARYRSLMAGRRMLVVLDNARSTEQVMPLLPGPDATVLVTSRLKLAGLVAAHGARSVSLDVLNEADARAFLRARLGADRVAAEQEVVADLVTWCGGLPLALSIVAARAAMEPDFPLAVFAEELREQPLDALDAGEIGTNLRAVFSWSAAALSDEAARAFALLGTVGTADVSLPAVAALLDRSVPRTRMVLRELENTHLLQQHVPGRYRMHDLVGLYAADLEADAGSRLLDFYAATARAAAATLEPHKVLPEHESGHALSFTDKADAMAWFDAEHDCLTTTQRRSLDNAAFDVAWLLGRTMNSYYSRRGRTSDDVDAWLIALRAAEVLQDSVKQAAAHMCLGLGYVELGQSSLGHRHFERSLELFAQTDDHVAHGSAHRAMAWAAEFEGDLGKALEHSLAGLAKFRAAGSEIREAESLNEVGWRYACLGRYAEARAYCEDAMLLNDKLGHTEGAAATLDSLAHIAHHDGRDADAVAHYREALALYRQLDNSAEEATVLEHLGDVLFATGSEDEAREQWRRALELYEKQRRASEAAALTARL
ncbi:AfsR/SARP family transcriptional regulator [Lentzea nigeriaca]|uniref:AfsR/SARP family transcriptional regulator n=1 Tax=Lentzea nigeriaca TaxID=1128665 RepID=UPI001959C75E|nr:BTAD domain-containing putative transcriptional regulator [Lentzea nigeriaca]MBM7857422.1 DNA-binding SARP family transcriptional activator/Tfp pilus assembly protein PilF [Lentzea nigeriaca]